MGGESSGSIAIAMHVSPSRIRQILSRYRNNHEIPVLRKPGRPSRIITEREIDSVMSYYEEYHSSSIVLERILRSNGILISHNVIHRILKERKIAMDDKRKSMRRKWVKYERDHANSLWHTDWYEISDPRWHKRYLIAYIDDSSRFITGYGVFISPSTENTLSVLEDAIGTYGTPDEILTDHGSQFYSNYGAMKSPGISKFQEYLQSHGIKHILGRIDHPQTNGKIERFFATFQAKIHFFGTIDEFMKFYNFKRPHMSLDFDNLETPYHAFIKRAKVKA